MKSITKEDIVSRLQGVIDPCSAATKVSLSIVEMGMVEDVHFSLGDVTVALRMTSPLCHALPFFEMEIERVLAGVPGIASIKCTFDHGGNWEPDDMTVGARKKLADQRELVRNKAATLDGAVPVHVHAGRRSGPARTDFFPVTSSEL